MSSRTESSENRAQEESTNSQEIVVTAGIEGHGLTDAEITALLAQQEEGTGEEGSAQIVDGEGNVISVSAEQLASAGIDINNIGEMTEEQLASLIQLANSSGVSAPKTENNRSNNAEVVLTTASSSHPISSILSAQQSSQQQPVQDYNQSERQQASNSNNQQQSMEQESSLVSNSGPEEPAGDLTMVLGEDGSLRLVDQNGSEFLLTSEQLIAQGIDLNNLTEDAVQTVLQMAMNMEPVAKQNLNKRIGGGVMSVEPSQKRMRADQIPSLTDHHTALKGNHAKSSRNFGLIGQEVEVRKGNKDMGKPRLATIRYCRAGEGYKVQFEDGHFEWVSEHQISIREPGKFGAERHSYSGDDVAGDRSATQRSDHSHHPRPIVPKLQNGPGNSGLSSTSAGPLGARRVPPAIPGIRVSQPISLLDEDQDAMLDGGLGRRSQSGDRTESEPNFSCPICEKKTYQKEPAYIVIRLPACDSCADNKILVLDEETVSSKSRHKNHATESNSDNRMTENTAQNDE